MRQRKRRLLLVEENPHIVSVLSQTLKVDFDITVATNGREAVRLLIQGKQFDFVITELNLPLFDGLDLIKLIRMSKLAGQTPIMVLSGDLDSANRIACLEAGADSYMTKPFNPLEVKAKLHSVFRREAQADIFENVMSTAMAGRQRQLWPLSSSYNVI
jgi:DNA-binding response OmpR family regulator